MNQTIEATKLSFSHLTALIGQRVAVTVIDNPKLIQNGPFHYAGIVESVHQLDPAGRNINAGEGDIRFIGGLTARWTKHQSVSIKTI